MHLNPEDAVEVHQLVRSKQIVAMHWGTLALSDEPILEPPQRLAAELRRKDIPQEAFLLLKHERQEP